ncbi:GroES-like protein [Xylaria cf. heliscus]|nr:GroES-like protein [Xylaria cf. heliscus]
MALAAIESLPTKQSAIIAGDEGTLVLTHDAPLPSLRPGMVLVKTMAVGINPVDMKLSGRMANIGAVCGCDFSGMIVAIPQDVPEGRFSLGDRVAGVVPGMDSLFPENGAFAEYVYAYVDFTWLLPAEMPFEIGATLGVSSLIAGYALFQSLCLPGHPEAPTTKPEYVLVYGGSTSSGTMMIQLLRKSGFMPITTCSPRNFRLVEEYGAEKSFDYHDPDSAEAIRSFTKNALWYAVDCYCEGSSMEFCYRAIGRAGGKKAIEPDFVLAHALLGIDVGWKEPYNVKADPELYSFGKDWSLCIQRLLESGSIKPHPIRAQRNTGLQHILDGIMMLKDKAVSGEKLVYRVITT